MQVSLIIEGLFFSPGQKLNTIHYPPKGGAEKIRFTIYIPLWLIRILIRPVLLYRRFRYGYCFCRIPLSQGKFATVDPDDYFRLAKDKWYAVKGSSTFYAVRGIKTKDGKLCRLHMHREVLKVPDNMLVDHINRKGLDNRKANLRPATKAQNMRNRKKHTKKSRSKYKGLYWQEHNKKWRVRIAINKTRLQLGQFSNEIEAAKAYDRAAKKYHGQFAALNFPNKKPPKTTPKKA